MSSYDQKPVTQRPLSVTVISLIYIVVGIVGLVFHLVDFKGQLALRSEITWISAVRLLAIVAGIFMLRGHNWARWLALAWMAFHVVLGALNSPSQLVMHAFLLVIFGYFLLRHPASNYFHSTYPQAETQGH
jgi:uncharacterized membrane protein